MFWETFGAWDWAILFTTIFSSIFIGMYFRFTGGRQKTNREFLLADGNLATFPVAVSLMANFISAITLLGVSAENYYYGMQFVVINLGYIIATPIATELYLPVFYNLQRTSAYEYLELRFGPNIRLLASLTYTLQMILYNGIVLYAPAIVLESVTGLDRVFSILVVGLVCTFYATLGGMKAVVFTDVLQSLLMYVAVLSIAVYTCVHFRGITPIINIAREDGRLDFSNFDLDPTIRHTWWSLILGGMFMYLNLCAANQTQVQRFLTVKSVGTAKRCLWWCLPITSVLSLTTCFSGIAIYAMYRNCDPLQAGTITAKDQLMPYYVKHSMRAVPGMLGLFVAGIFSASLSTVSSSCNALAAVTLADYAGRFCNISPSTMPWLTKLASCVFGLVFLSVAFLAEHLGGVLQAALTIFGAVGGPLLGVFSLGMFTTYAREGGTIVGLLTGMAVTIWASFGGPRPSTTMLPVGTECLNTTMTKIAEAQDSSNYFYLYRISYLYTSVYGALLTVLVGTVVSVAWRQPAPWQRAGLSHPDPALFTPPLARVLQRRQATGKEKEAQSELLPVVNCK